MVVVEYAFVHSIHIFYAIHVFIHYSISSSPDLTTVGLRLIVAPC
jgi:hypothetical protein